MTFSSQPEIFSTFEHCVWSCVVPQVWFSSQGNIFHSNRSHWLPRCLPVDYFWAMTNVTVMKMTTFIFNRVWQEKWKWKHRNSSPVLQLKHSSAHKLPGFSTLSYKGFHAALSHTARKCNRCPHNETLMCMPYSVPGGMAKELPVLFFWFSKEEQTLQFKDINYMFECKEIKFCSYFYQNKKWTGL